MYARLQALIRDNDSQGRISSGIGKQAKGEEQKQKTVMLNVCWTLGREIRSLFRGEISGWRYICAYLWKCLKGVDLHF